MKVKAFEKICNEFGGSYEQTISETNQFIFLSWRTCRHALFPDDLAKIKRIAKKEEYRLQYIAAKSDGISLEFVKS